ncbi:hypothetical protein V6U77_23690 [Micromonospora sp. CPCC 205546]|uniref:hypothetical protein n=1 Tax=Micromonospora sp. CPCC 205546 TaxID=3122397 RepID=UPI002FEFC78F
MSPRRTLRPPLIRLGAPGPYVLAAAFATAAWFAARLLDGSGRSPAEALLGAGVGGVPWGLFPLTLGWVVRADRDPAWEAARRALRRGRLPADEQARAAAVDHLPVARRGAVLGMAGGVALFGGLAALAVALDRPLTAGLLGTVLAVVLAVAALTMARVRRLERSLGDPGQGG